MLIYIYGKHIVIYLKVTVHLRSSLSSRGWWSNAKAFGGHFGALPSAGDDWPSLSLSLTLHNSCWVKVSCAPVWGLWGGWTDTWDSYGYINVYPGAAPSYCTRKKKILRHIYVYSGAITSYCALIKKRKKRKPLENSGRIHSRII